MYRTTLVARLPIWLRHVHKRGAEACHEWGFGLQLQTLHRFFPQLVLLLAHSIISVVRREKNAG